MSQTVENKDRRISIPIGSLLGVLFFVAGCGVTWGTMRADLNSINAKDSDQDKKINKLEGIYERIASVEAKLDLIVRKLP